MALRKQEVPLSQAWCAGALSCWKTNMSPAMLQMAGSSWSVVDTIDSGSWPHKHQAPPCNPASTLPLRPSVTCWKSASKQRLIWYSNVKATLRFQQASKDCYKNNCKERKHAPRKGALWWYPELDKLRKECNNNIRRARRNLIDKETAKTARKRYKSTIRQCKRESWRRFCRSVSGPRPASRLFIIQDPREGSNNLPG